jgi:stress response protein YsnF
MFRCGAAEHPAPQRVRSGQQEGTEVAKTAAKERVTVPVVEERAVVRKRKKVTDAVRVRTEVREAVEVVDAPLAVERVEVERRPLDRWIDAPVPTRQEGDTTVITLHEEVVVVEKRLRATEEVRITRRTSTRHAEERVTLRREEAVVERLDPAEAGNGDPD